MWAYELVGPGSLEQTDAPTPSREGLAVGSVLLRTLAGGICGSDIPKLTGAKGACVDGDGRLGRGRPGYPMHEVVGEVIASRSDEIRDGARVVGWATHNDGLAEFTVTAADQLHTYDRSLTPVDAVLIQPLACVLEAIDRIAVRGEDVAVIGLGPIGLLFAHAAKGRGARRVTGIDPVDRSDVAEKFGIDELVVAPARTWARSVSDGNRPTTAIEAVGHQVSTLDDAVAGLAVGGTLLYFGIPDDEYYPLNMERFLRKNLTLIAGVTRRRRQALAAADAYLDRFPELNPTLVTHRFPAAAAQSAFDAAATPKRGRLKVVISFTDVDSGQAKVGVPQ
ncbi:zinc-binding dehydrogenase [Mycobacterium sp. NPDC003449]